MSNFLEVVGLVFDHHHRNEPGTWTHNGIHDIGGRLFPFIRNHAGNVDAAYGLRGALLLVSPAEWNYFHTHHGQNNTHQVERAVRGAPGEEPSQMATILDDAARAELDILRDQRFSHDYKNSLLAELRRDAWAQAHAVGDKLRGDANARYDAAKSEYSVAYANWRKGWDVGSQLIGMYQAQELTAAHPVEIGAAITTAEEAGDYHTLEAINRVVVPSMISRSKVGQDDFYGKAELIVDTKQRLADAMMGLEPVEVRELGQALKKATAARDLVQKQIDFVSERFKHFVKGI